MIDIRDKLPRHPTKKWKTRKNIDTIVVHCSDGSSQDPVSYARFHITPSPDNHLSTSGAPGLAYHDLITKDGTVYHCNLYSDSTWHAKFYNDRSVGVCMAFRPETENPSGDQIMALFEHVAQLCLWLKVSPNRVFGHRELPWMFKIFHDGSKGYLKTCPGMQVNLDSMRSEIAKFVQINLQRKGLYDGMVDGKFGPKSEAALMAFKPEQHIA